LLVWTAMRSRIRACLSLEGGRADLEFVGRARIRDPNLEVCREDWSAEDEVCPER